MPASPIGTPSAFILATVISQPDNSKTAATPKSASDFAQSLQTGSSAFRVPRNLMLKADVRLVTGTQPRLQQWFLPQ